MIPKGCDGIDSAVSSSVQVRVSLDQEDHFLCGLSTHFCSHSFWRSSWWPRLQLLLLLAVRGETFSCSSLNFYHSAQSLEWRLYLKDICKLNSIEKGPNLMIEEESVLSACGNISAMIVSCMCPHEQILECSDIWWKIISGCLQGCFWERVA